MADKLQVQIGAEIKELKSKLAKATKLIDKLKDTEKELKKAFDSGSISAEKYYNAISVNSLRLEKVKNRSNELRKSLIGGGAGFNKLGKSSANAIPALTEFSRVIQDAPYGINGVSNNITQLTSSFGYLSKSAGGTKNALKLMLGSLTGPAGILLGISAVTSLLVTFGDELFNTSEKQDELSKNTKGTNKELESQKTILEELIEKFDTFDKIRTKSTFNTVKEREELKALTANVLDYTQSEEIRNRALNELQKSYAKYFEGLKISDTNSLIKAEQEVNKVLIRKEKRIQTLNKLEKTSQALQLNLIEIEQKRGSVNINDIKRLKFLDEENLKLRELQNELRNALELYTSFDLDFSPKKKTRPKVQGIDTTGLQRGLQDVITIDTTLVTNATNSVDLYAQKLLELQQTSLMVNNAISNSFNTLGNTIATTLGNSAGVFGVFTGELIRQMLKYLTQDALFTKKKILLDTSKAKSNAIVSASETASKTPFGAFILPALITAGTTAIASAFSGIGSNNISNETNNGNFSNSGLTRSFGGGQSEGSREVVFRLQGTDLVGSFVNTLQRNRNLGGSVKLAIG